MQKEEDVVYILLRREKRSDGKHKIDVYVGITNDLGRRLGEHSSRK